MRPSFGRGRLVKTGARATWLSIRKPVKAAGTLSRIRLATRPGSSRATSSQVTTGLKDRFLALLTTSLVRRESPATRAIRTTRSASQRRGPCRRGVGLRGTGRSPRSVGLPMTSSPPGARRVAFGRWPSRRRRAAAPSPATAAPTPSSTRARGRASTTRRAAWWWPTTASTNTARGRGGATRWWTRRRRPSLRSTALTRTPPVQPRWASL